MKKYQRVLLLSVFFSFIGVSFSNGLLYKKNIQVEDVFEYDEVVRRVTKVKRKPASIHKRKAKPTVVAESFQPDLTPTEQPIVDIDSSNSLGAVGNDAYVADNEIQADSPSSETQTNTFSAPTTYNNQTNVTSTQQSAITPSQIGINAGEVGSAGPTYAFSNTSYNPDSGSVKLPPHKVKSITFKDGAFIVKGENLESISKLVLKSADNSSELEKISSTSSQVLAMGFNALKLIAGKTYSLIISDAHGSSSYPISLEMADGSVTARKLAPLGASEDGYILKWDASSSRWIAAPDEVGAGPDGGITSITKGTGIVGEGASITTVGSIAVDVGTGANQIPQFDPDQKLIIPSDNKISFTENVEEFVFGMFNEVFKLRNQTNDTDIFSVVGNDFLVGGRAVCLSDGTNCPAGTAAVESISVSAPLTMSGTSNVSLGVAVDNSTITVNGSSQLSIPNAAITANKLNQMGATLGQVLKWNGSTWAPAVDTDTGITTEVDPHVRAFARTDGSGVAPVNCDADQTWTHDIILDTFVCRDIQIDPSQVTGLNQHWDSATGGINYAGGSLGIGTNTPGNTAVKSFTKLVDLVSNVDNSNIGYSMRINEGVNNRRVAFFLDDSTGTYGVDSTASTMLAEFVMQVNGAEKFRLANTGFVGLGTSTPRNELEVLGSGQPRIAIRTLNESTSESTELGFQVGSAANSSTNTTALIRSTITQAEPAALKGDLRFLTNSGDTAEERMIITDSGNVGIGTSTPSSKLEVAGIIKATGFEGPMTSTSVATGTGSAAAPAYSFSNSSSTGLFSTSAGVVGVSSGGTHTFNFTSNSFTSATSGGASIASTAGTASAPTFSFAGDSDTGWYSPLANTIAAATGGVERIRIDSAGNVGIGTTNPEAKLQVNGVIGTNNLGIDIFRMGPFESPAPTYFYIDTKIPFSSSAGQLIVRGMGYGAGKDINLTVSWYGYVLGGGFLNTRFHAEPGTILPSRIRMGTWDDAGVERIRIEIANDGRYWNSYQFNILKHSGITNAHLKGWVGYQGEMPVDTSKVLTLSRSNALMETITGNVGIGTSTPSTKLEVVGTIKATSFEGPVNSTSVSTGTGSAAAPTYSFSNSSNTGLFSTSAGVIGVSSGGTHTFNFTNTGFTSTTAGGASIASTAGTASSPTYSFAGDPNTGWYSPLEDTIAASTGGVERLRIDSAGNVGIGTNNPNSKLSIDIGSNPTTPGMTISGGATVNQQSHLLLHDTGTSGANRIDVDFAFSNSTPNARISSLQRGVSSVNGASLVLETTSDNSGTYNTNQLVLENSGNVGVGKLSPLAKLDVASAGNALTNYTARFQSSSSVNGAGGILFDQNSTYGYKIHTQGTSATSGTLYFNYVNVADGSTVHDNVLVLRNGNIGVGTDSPATKFHVHGPIRVSGSSVMDSTFSGDNWTMRNIYTGAGWARNLLRFTDSAGAQYFNFGANGSGQGFNYGYIGQNHVDNAIKWGANNYVTIGGSTQNIPAHPLLVGTDSLAVTDGKNVGIGTTTPANKLEISKDNPMPNNINGDPDNFINAASLKISSATTDGGNALYLGTTDTYNGRNGWIQAGHKSSSYAASTDDSELYLQPLGGKVGIGATTIPVYTLDVNGEIRTTTRLRVGATGEAGITAGTNDVVLRDALNNVAFRGTRSNSSWSPAIDAQWFQVGNANDAVVFSTATGLPAARMKMATASFQIATGTGSNAPTGLFEVSNNTKGLFNVLADGKVGVGTTAPAEKLTVYGNQARILLRAATADIADSNSIDFSEDNTGPHFQMRYDGNAQNGNHGRMIFSAPFEGKEIITFERSGNVGVGTTTPSEKLHVAGNILATGTITPSDIHLKKNFEPVENALEKINGLSAVTYDWKDQEKFSNKRQMGVIAQEVDKVFPEAVTKTNDGFLAVSYTSLISPLIAAVKELYQKILSLYEMLTVHETQLQSQSRQIASADQNIQVLQIENEEVKAKNKALEAENAMIKAYLCQKDPEAPFCQK